MCLPSRCPETGLVYPPISWSLHSNGSTRYNSLSSYDSGENMCPITPLTLFAIRASRCKKGGPRQRSHSRVRVPRVNLLPYFTVSDSRLPQPGGPGPRISPRNRVTHLYPQALGSLCVASYDSQGYGGGI
jgi:hypothetical protein